MGVAGTVDGFNETTEGRFIGVNLAKRNNVDGDIVLFALLAQLNERFGTSLNRGPNKEDDALFLKLVASVLERQARHRDAGAPIWDTSQFSAVQSSLKLERILSRCHEHGRGGREHEADG